MRTNIFQLLAKYLVGTTFKVSPENICCSVSRFSGATFKVSPENICCSASRFSSWTCFACGSSMREGKWADFLMTSLNVSLNSSLEYSLSLCWRYKQQNRSKKKNFLQYVCLIQAVLLVQYGTYRPTRMDSHGREKQAPKTAYVNKKDNIVLSVIEKTTLYK